MRSVGVYIWDHLGGRRHIGWSVASAIVAYAAMLAIHYAGIQLFSEFGPVWNVKNGPVVFRSTSWFEVFTLLGFYLAGVWGAVGVIWSAVRTVQGRNPAGSVFKFLSLSILLLLTAAVVVVTYFDIRRLTGG